MELKISQYTPASAIEFNYEELKTELLAKAQQYSAVVYTEDTMKEAKADRAALNALKKALNDERLRREREFLAPFNDFKQKINEIIAIIDRPVAAIDTQVKAFEAAEKDKKRSEIVAAWDAISKPDFLKLSDIWSEAWLNKTQKLDAIKKALQDFVESVQLDLDAMERMHADDIAIEAYKRMLNVTAALDEAERIREMQAAAKERRRAAEEAAEAKRIADAEAAAAQNAAQTAQEAAANALNDAGGENIDEQQKSANSANSARWLKFEAYMTIEQAYLLRDFCRENGIELRKPQN